MKFLKKRHLIIKYKKDRQFIQSIKQGFIGLYFLKNGLLPSVQLAALIFFLKKRLKLYCKKLFLRVQFTSQFTSKPIGVRMGKGKGSLDNIKYSSIFKSQIFLEFFFDTNISLLNYKLLVKKIKLIIFKCNKKMHLKVNILENPNFLNK
jgi:ribosomal protein L16/L10AE